MGEISSDEQNISRSTILGFTRRKGGAGQAAFSNESHLVTSPESSKLVLASKQRFRTLSLLIFRDKKKILVGPEAERSCLEGFWRKEK